MRTLPLSVGGVLLGILLAVADWQVNWLTAVLVVLTAACIHILATLSGEKFLRGLFVVLSMVSGTWMVYSSWGTLLDIGKPAAQMDWSPTLLLLVVAGAIMAAVKHTPGKSPYMFMLLGPLTVVGAYLVCCHTVFWRLLLPGAAVGLLSMGVMCGDRRVFPAVVTALGWACMVAYCLLRWHSWWHYLFVLTLPLYILQLKGVKKLGVISAFLFCVLAGFGFVVNLL